MGKSSNISIYISLPIHLDAITYSLDIQIKVWRFFYKKSCHHQRRNHVYSLYLQNIKISIMSEINNDILQSSQNSNQLLPALPNATTSLVLGILSLVGCFLYAVPGFILGIIGLVLANKDRKLYQLNPGMFSAASYSNSNAGRICSLIGVILSSICLLFVVIVIAMVGFTAFNLDELKSLSNQ